MIEFLIGCIVGWLFANGKLTAFINHATDKINAVSDRIDASTTKGK